MSKVKTSDILKKDMLTENEVKLLCRRANAGEKFSFSEDKINSGVGYALTKEQTEKGKAWLLNQWKTPRGVERKNNPFGYREEKALEEFVGFELTDIHDAGNYHVSFYVPLYNVVSENEDGTYTGFQYYVVGGKIKIIG